MFFQNKLLDHLTDELLPYFPKVTHLDFQLRFADQSQIGATDGILLLQSQLSKFKTRVKTLEHVTCMVREGIQTEAAGNQAYLDFTQWVLCPRGDGEEEWCMEESWYYLTDAATGNTVEFVDRREAPEDHD